MSRWVEIRDRADELRANWHEHDDSRSSSWRPFWPKGEEPVDAEFWCWVEYERKIQPDDCSPLDESNEAAIREGLKPFMADDPRRSAGPGPDVIDGRRLGTRRGYAIRVSFWPDEDELFDPEHGPIEPELTEAFMAWCDMQDQLSVEPLLDDTDYYDREYDLWAKATLGHIGSVARRLDWVEDLPDGWEVIVFDWIRENDEDLFEDRICEGTDFFNDDLKFRLRRAIYALGLHARVCEDWGRMPRSLVEMLREQAEKKDQPES